MDNHLASALDRAIALVCCRARLDRESRDEFRQDMWIRALQPGPLLLTEFRGESSLDTFLFRVVSRDLLDWIRSARKGSRLSLPDTSRSEAAYRTLCDKHGEFVLDVKRVCEWLFATIRTFRRIDRNLIWGHFCDSLPIAVIARTTGKPQRLLYSQLNRMLRRLSSSASTAGLRPADVRAIFESPEISGVQVLLRIRRLLGDDERLGEALGGATKPTCLQAPVPHALEVCCQPCSACCVVWGVAADRDRRNIGRRGERRAG